MITHGKVYYIKGITILGHLVVLLKWFIWFSIHHWYKEDSLWSSVDHRLDPLVVDYSFRFNPFDLTHRSNPSNQNRVLAKVILKLITLNLRIYFNSIKLRDASITLSRFIKKREYYPDFLCMNAMHNSIFYAIMLGCYNISPLKLNFVLEVRTLLCSGR